MSAFTPQSFSWAAALHVGAVLAAGLWAWFTPAQKPPPAVFIMVAAPPADVDSDNPRAGRQGDGSSGAPEERLTPPEPAPRTPTRTASVSQIRVKKYKPVDFSKYVQAPPEPSEPLKTSKANADTGKVTPTPDPKTKPKNMSYQEWMAQQKKGATTPNKSTTGRPGPVKAPNIATDDIAQGLRGGMGNATTRNRFSGLGQGEQNAMSEYYMLLRALLENSWVRPEGMSHRLSTTVNFTVTASGAIIGAKIKESSGASVYDDTVMAIFSQVRSFRPPPAGGSWNFDLTFTLED